MVFHQATQMAMCHHCLRTGDLPEACPACGGKLLLFGLGIQRIEAELVRKFPSARFARVDSDTMSSPRQFERVFESFAAGELDILLGTQMVAKGLDFPRISLVGVVSADTSLRIPDFRASERTFQLVVQVAGRAGRADLPGEVVVQTLFADEPAIRFAAAHDYDGFAAWEMPMREEAQLPPFWRIVRFVLRHEKAAKAEQAAGMLAETLKHLLAREKVITYGPQPASIMKIRGLFRFQVLVIFARPGRVQELVFARLEELSRRLPAELIADVDPAQLM